jgi:hypothetical protein
MTWQIMSTIIAKAKETGVDCNKCTLTGSRLKFRRLFLHYE